MLHSPIFIAQDNMELSASVDLVSKLKGHHAAGFKVNDFWDNYGRAGLEKLREAGAYELWVDVKVKDTPNTVANRIASISQAGVSYITVMADGEVDMMMGAVKARTDFLKKEAISLDIDGDGIPAIGPGIIAVTVLTSLTEEQTHLTYGQPVKAAALYLARLAKLSGIDIIVCSPQEVSLLSKRPELSGMSFFTPGIRPTWKKPTDQKRIDTPRAAILAGVTSIVVGRAITEAQDPVAAFDVIYKEVGLALRERQRGRS
ncbi:MAG: orotidine 5'-phosphate decarboxylase [Candidatus Sungbacteria bacterium]|uniref:Orotidine 5'-phosphate decarboxylase n=1 Tax=Candidatus Sungiibacteriota bacterium TaxID=2750080 RepID=A0A9D6LNI4_9BACT|nr:orotidine 5'-phosphate decarboxylase [Candidatus Sungbacteria bacterium]